MKRGKTMNNGLYLDIANNDLDRPNGFNDAV